MRFERGTGTPVTCFTAGFIQGFSGATLAMAVLDGGRAVHLLYGPRPGLPAPPPGVPLVRLTEAPAAADERQSADGQLLTWQGGEGRWAADEMGGGTLEWIQGGLALRLETPLTSAEAAAIAASLAPLAD